MRRFLGSLLLVSLVSLAFGQCEIPKSQFERAPNIFTPEQEGFLGDIVLQQLTHSLHPIDDPALNSYLNDVAQRLLQTAPPSPYHYHFQLIDEPYTNAFGTPGGRIYVSRKAALLAKDEDELAGLLGHEISHIYTRQLGADYTRRFQQILGVTQVGDRADVARKYHLLLDTWRKKKFKVEDNHEEQEQYVADQTALYLMALAGYRTSAFGDYFDRLAETKGKTGSFWSDFLGTTPPGAKRLKLILDNVSSLPASCIAHTRPAGQDFARWKQQLLEWSAPSVKNDLRDVVLQTKLQPPLLSEVYRLRFSPDGKYILAQDDSTVSVLTREPFAFVFRVSLPDYPVESTFSPDSKFLVVAGQEGRVEKWDLATSKRISVAELSVGKQCLQTKVSPDGNTFACYRFESLQLLDVASGNVIFEKKKFFEPNYQEIWAIYIYRLIGATFNYINLDFSSDGRYFAASAPLASLALDMTTKSPVGMAETIKSGMQHWFAFAGPGRIFVRWRNEEDTSLLEFPSGKLVCKFPVGVGNPRAATKADMVPVFPARDGTAIYDIDARKYVGVMKSIAFDFYGKQYVKENPNGDLMLAEVDTKNWSTNSQHVQLPTPQLGNVRVASVSEDLHWLAVSQTSRGGVFDLTQGTRQDYLRNFLGAWFSPDRQLWAEFPKFEKMDRSLACFNPGNDMPVSQRPVGEEVLGRQEGPYFFGRRYQRNSVTVEVHKVSTDELLWSRELKDNPTFDVNAEAGTVVIAWAASAQAAKEAAHADPNFAAKLNRIKDRDKSYYMEVCDLGSGKVLGHLAVDTGQRSFSAVNVQAGNNTLALADNEGRIHVYNLAADDDPGIVFASGFFVSRAGLMGVNVDPHRIQVLDPKTMEVIDEYSFQEPIAASLFVGDGTSLLVLTRDQTAYILKPQSHDADLAQAAK